MAFISPDATAASDVTPALVIGAALVTVGTLLTVGTLEVELAKISSNTTITPTTAQTTPVRDSFVSVFGCSLELGGGGGGGCGGGVSVRLLSDFRRSLLCCCVWSDV